MLWAQTSGCASTVDIDGIEVAAEVAEERLDEHVGPKLFQPANGSRDVPGAPVEQVVPVDHRHDDVLERHPREGSCDVLGLANVDRASGLACRDSAKTAPARARVAQQHHGRRPLAPALAEVGATGLFADGMQVEIAKRLLELRVALAAGGPDLEPRRLGREAGAGLAGFVTGSPSHVASLGTNVKGGQPCVTGPAPPASPPRAARQIPDKVPRLGGLSKANLCPVLLSSDRYDLGVFAQNYTTPVIAYRVPRRFRHKTSLTQNHRENAPHQHVFDLRQHK